MLIFELIHSIPSRLYNFILAVLMCFFTVYLYLYASDIAKEYKTDQSVIELYLIVTGVIVFFFLSRFQSALGQFLKALSYILIGSFVVYITRNLQDENAILIIRGIVGLIVAFGLYAFVSSVYKQSKEEDLKKNGWRMDTRYLKTIIRPSDEESWYVIQTIGRHPSSGEDLFFISDEVFSNPVDKISEDEIFIVYVDKKNPKRYYFDEDSIKRLY